VIEPALLADLPLARAAVDRAAHRRADAEWLAASWSAARILALDQDGRAEIETTASGVRLALRSAADVEVRAEIAPGERIDGLPLFLGATGETAFFAVRSALSPSVSVGGLRDVGTALDDRDAGLLVTAVGLVNWHDSHLFSPRTGAPTIVREGGWVREAVDGSGSMWPRTDPAVIMVVTDGMAGPHGRALLGRQAAWPAGRYSTLAGFVEPGESAEMAVAREVAEESGVHVSGVAYVASQPWPFPGSIMLGYSARADPSAPVTPDRTELEDARWFTREEFLGDAAPVGPPPVSISSFLIRRWLDGFTDRG
jgi:NAD+ diphosphatase